MKHIWEDILKVQDIGLRDDFFKLGGHSLNAVSLSSKIAKAYGAKVAVRTIFDNPTIEKLSAFLRQEVSLSPPGAVIPLNTDGTAYPLFCIHPGGGLIHCYVALARHLGSEQPLYAIQSVGLEGEQAPIQDIPSMAARYIQDIRQIQPQGPYQIAGLSMGASVAFEMAQQLTRSGAHVSFLALLDPSPRLETTEFADINKEQATSDWQRLYVLDAAREIGIFDEAMMALSPDEQLTYYLDKAKSCDKMPIDISITQFRKFLDVFCANSLASRHYHPAPYDGWATLFRTQAIPGLDETFGWAPVLRGGYEVIEYPGTHGSLISDPSVRELAADFVTRMSNQTGRVLSQQV